MESGGRDVKCLDPTPNKSYYTVVMITDVLMHTSFGLEEIEIPTGAVY